MLPHLESLQQILFKMLQKQQQQQQQQILRQLTVPPHKQTLLHNTCTRVFTPEVSFRDETIRVYGEESEREMFHILFQGSFSPPIALYYDPSLKKSF